MISVGEERAVLSSPFCDSLREASVSRHQQKRDFKFAAPTCRANVSVDVAKETATDMDCYAQTVRQANLASQYPRL